MKKPCFIICGIVISFISCEPTLRYHTGTFPDTPVNMGAINTEFDDYNSDIPVLGGTFPLCFSSNRNSDGGNYDIVYKLIDVWMSKKTGDLAVEENTSGNLDVYQRYLNLLNALSVINTQADELGPYIIPQGDRFKRVGSGYEAFQNFVVLYASDQGGNLDIRMTDNLTGDRYSSPVDVAFLNSDFDDAYPTVNSDSSRIYFCSNRGGGDFDIWYTDLGTEGILFDALKSGDDHQVNAEAVLSSGYDDKCPYIHGNLMVFTSDRPGGFGGFDLWYSVFDGSDWSFPVNFGDKINTEYDEYRPIVKEFPYDFTNDFMIFSSNRPGGAGGFDLYYVGVEKMTGE